MPSAISKLDVVRYDIAAKPGYYFDPDTFFPKKLHLRDVLLLPLNVGFIDTGRTTYNPRGYFVEAELWTQSRLCGGFHSQVIEFALEQEIGTRQGYFLDFLHACRKVMENLEDSGALVDIPSFTNWVAFSAERRCEFNLQLLGKFSNLERFQTFSRDAAGENFVANCPDLGVDTANLLSTMKRKAEQDIRGRPAKVQAQLIALVESYGQSGPMTAKTDLRQLKLKRELPDDNDDPFGCSPKADRRNHISSNIGELAASNQPRFNFNSKYNGKRTVLSDPETGKYALPPPKFNLKRG